MTAEGIALAAIVILLFPMGYFLLASPAFLLVKLEIPEVAQLLRGMFKVHFLMVSIAGIIGTVAFALAGRLGLRHRHRLDHGFRVLGTGSVLASVGRPAERQGCRRCRCGAPSCAACIGAACSAMPSQLAAVVASIPYVAST